MSKIKLRPIITLILVTCIASYFYLKNKYIDSKNQINQEQKAIEIKPPKLNEKIKQQENKQRTKHAGISKKALITYVNEFDDDPVLENQVLMRRHTVCMEYFYYKQNSITGKRAEFKTKQQQKFYLQATKRCEKLNKAHPEYDLNATIKQRVAKNKLTATTRLGILLEPNNIEYTEEEIRFIFKMIAQRHPELINSSILYKTLQYKIDIMTPQVMQIIQATQVNYASRIIHDTENYLACQLGADCSNQSTMMYYYCNSEPNFCVNSFDELFNTRFPSAVRADILLALPYIESIYQLN